MTDTTKKTYDLAQIDLVKASNEGREVEITHPITGDPLGMFVRVLGRESDTFREIIQDRIDKQIEQQAKAKRRSKPKTVAQGEEEAVELLAACTTGWRGVVLEGKELEFTVANVKMVYKHWAWFRAQVDDAIGDLSGFLPN